MPSGQVRSTVRGPEPLVRPLAQIEAANAVSKFAALGTYLANLRDGTTRERYTQLTWELEKIVAQAVRTSRADLDKLFEAADKMFSVMNDDCVKSAKNPV